MPDITVDSYHDLVSDDELDLTAADTLADVLPTSDDQLAFWLPLWLAGEKPLEPAGQSDEVFVGTPIPERETEKAYYIKQGHAGVWVPKSVVRVYRASADAEIVSPQASLGGSTEGSA